MTVAYGFLSCLIPEALEDSAAVRSDKGMQAAANALQWHLYNGLCRNLQQEIRLFNVLPVGSFPQYNSRPVIPQQSFATDYCKDNVNVGQCNVKFLRKLLLPRRIYGILRHWCTKTPGQKLLFVYTLSAEFMTAVSGIKERFPELRVCAIVADLPGMTNLSSRRSVAARLFDRYRAGRTARRLASIDAFSLLTEQMAQYLKLTQPYCVIEGIADDTERSACPKQKDGLKRILYTGTLHSRFGVPLLLLAFALLKDPDYRLILCGTGDSTELVQTAARMDDRIQFLGKLPREKVLELQHEAAVLVNPRQNTEEFAKYSFPSKNLEYLASGTPVIAYKLDGIPAEYDRLIHYVPDCSPESLAEMIVSVCDRDKMAAMERANAAAEFVRKEKNELVQTKKIVCFLKEHGLIP